MIVLIGAGGMGEVYRTRDARLARDVAIKWLPDLAGSDHERIARFECEGRALATLTHPNIAGGGGCVMPRPSEAQERAEPLAYVGDEARLGFAGELRAPLLPVDALHMNRR